MTGWLVDDLGIVPRAWLFLALLFCVTLFFKFSRIWSVRNLDVVLLFILGPAMVRLVASGYAWWAYFWLFVGSSFWLLRCILDIALTRRPVLEPNLNPAGLTCLGMGILGLLLLETVTLPSDSGAARNPAALTPDEQPKESLPGSADLEIPYKMAVERTLLPEVLKRSPLEVVLSRILAVLAHLAIVGGLYYIGWKHFEQRTAGLAAATCYLLLPYTRIALVDSGQLVASALIVASIAFFQRPGLTGLLIGVATCWIPACAGLIPLWAGFHRQNSGATRFVLSSVGLILLLYMLGRVVPGIESWGHALLARSWQDAGLLPFLELEPRGNSFWNGIDPVFRLPVLIAYGFLVALLALLPWRKDLGILISQSAALMVAAQYWFLNGGGTLIVLYLPLLLLMMFRPTLLATRLTSRPYADVASARTPLPVP